MKTIASCLVVLAMLALCGPAAAAAPPSYDDLVQQGRTELVAGDDTSALSHGTQAIRADANRWEAYALAGGALLNLRRYEEALDDLSKAIERAPADKQDALRELRRRALQPGSPSPPPAQASVGSSAIRDEIAEWKTIEDSSQESDFTTFVAQHPQSQFVPLAKDRIKAIRKRLGEDLGGTLWYAYIHENFAVGAGKIKSIFLFLSDGTFYWAKACDNVCMPEIGNLSAEDAAKTYFSEAPKFFGVTWANSGRWTQSGQELKLQVAASKCGALALKGTTTEKQITGEWILGGCGAAGSFEFTRLDSQPRP